MNVIKPTYELFYNGKNITGDILPFVLSLTYSDKASGETDELEVVVEDADGLWRYEWYPTKGDTLTARILRLGQALECGTFTIDEITGSGGSSGNTLSIKAIAAGINKKLRTETSYAHENKTLREIANTIAAKHALKVEGEINNVRIGRVTQYRETDLSFLHNLANEYGYTFSIRDKKLIFTNIYEIENKEAALTFTEEDILSWSITDKTSETYQSVKISYHNPQENKLISFEHTESAAAFKTAKADSLELRIRTENQQQAEMKAKAALYTANSKQQQGNIELSGNLFALAGNNCEVVGLGMFSGRYYIKTSTHTVTADGGYTTSIEIKRVGLVDKNKQDTSSSKNEAKDINAELKIIIRSMTMVANTYLAKKPLDKTMNLISDVMQKALNSINEKGYGNEYTLLNNGYEKVKQYADVQDDKNASLVAMQEAELAGKIGNKLAKKS